MAVRIHPDTKLICILRLIGSLLMLEYFWLDFHPTIFAVIVAINSRQDEKFYQLFIIYNNMMLLNYRETLRNIVLVYGYGYIL